MNDLHDNTIYQLNVNTSGKTLNWKKIGSIEDGCIVDQVMFSVNSVNQINAIILNAIVNYGCDGDNKKIQFHRVTSLFENLYFNVDISYGKSVELLFLKPYVRRHSFIAPVIQFVHDTGKLRYLCYGMNVPFHSSISLGSSELKEIGYNEVMDHINGVIQEIQCNAASEEAKRALELSRSLPIENRLYL